MFYYYVDKDFEYAEKTQFKLHNVLLLCKGGLLMWGIYLNLNYIMYYYYLWNKKANLRTQSFKLHNVLLLFDLLNKALYSLSLFKLHNVLLL